MSDQPNWLPLDFSRAEVAPGKTQGSFVLTVSGQKPRDAEGGAPVKLQPLTYVTQPEYWKIEVLWDSTNAIFQVVTPFTVSIPLDGIRGTKGIEVSGQTKVKKINT